jgi:hypothetical protein
MNTLVPIAVIALSLAAGWWLVQNLTAVFVVHVGGGVPRVARGRPAGGFLHDLATACQDFGVTDGTVRGHQRGRRVALSFSASIPPLCRQRIRNIWLTYER